jgi:hypothetical protein
MIVRALPIVALGCASVLALLSLVAQAVTCCG